MDNFLAEAKTYFVMMREDFPLILSGTLSLIAAFTILILGWIVAKILRRGIRNPNRSRNRTVRNDP